MSMQRLSYTKKAIFLLKKSMKDIFAYVLDLMFTLDKIQNNSSLM